MCSYEHFDTLQQPVIMPIIFPFIKLIDNVQMVLWDYTERATWEGTRVFTMMSEDYAEYTPVRFERL